VCVLALSHSRICWRDQEMKAIVNTERK